MDRHKFARTLAAIALGALSGACGDDPLTSGDAGTNAADAGVEITPRCTEPATVACVEEQIGSLQLYQNVSTGLIETESQSSGTFVQAVDGRGGGLNPTQSFTYARFTAGGLERVDISDSAAFESMDWHIAFRRYLVRVNSGVSGPSCTEVGRVDTTDFDAVTEVPEGLTFRREVYVDSAGCGLIPDGSGLPGAAAVALGSYWTYSMCVQTTGNVFVLRLADGRDVKFQVLSYYSPANQEVCNATGSAPMPSGAAQFRVRWAYLP